MNASDFAARTMEDNARTNTEALEQLIEEKEKSIIVVMDFYGGIMGSTAFSGSLTHALRQKEGRGALGASVKETFRESPNNEVGNAVRNLYSDPPDAAAAWWESRMTTQSYLLQTTPTTRAAYEYLPSTYPLCEEDQAVPVPF
ncbi:hypothetical protein AKAW_11391 [Aspergillus luchuensis IFO 4308]|nr:hypothetical protein AKAW_11391 [Aspergillus luchuensis IFO 4308]